MNPVQTITTRAHAEDGEAAYSILHFVPGSSQCLVTPHGHTRHENLTCFIEGINQQRQGPQGLGRHLLAGTANFNAFVQDGLQHSVVRETHVNEDDRVVDLYCCASDKNPHWDLHVSLVMAGPAWVQLG